MSSYNSSVGEWEEDADEEEEEEEVTLDLYSTCCKRECVETFHDTGKENAMDEVAKLYELVKNMPDGPQKAHFMKRVRMVLANLDPLSLMPQIFASVFFERREERY